MQHVLDGAQPVDQVVILKDHGDLGVDCAQVAATKMRDVAALKNHAALAWLDQTVDAAQKRRLTRAGRTDHRNKFAGLDSGVDAL